MARLGDVLHAFVIDLASRRVQIVGSTPHPDELFMRQMGRTLTAAEDDALLRQFVLICDRDRKWSGPVRQLLADAGIRVVQTPFQAPNANASRNGSCAPSGASASTASSRWESTICDGPFANSLSTTTGNAIIKSAQ